jgi:hypothetical protein
MTGEAWYTNKDLFEMQQGLKKDLQETRSLIQQYNGLGGRMDKLEQALINLAKAQSDCMARQQERTSVGKTIREWGGWLVAIGTFASKALGWW